MPFVARTLRPAAAAAALLIVLPALGAKPEPATKPATISSATATEKVDFSRDVLPILSANCFVCHGRDVSTRQAKLRLDLREPALALRSGTAPIAPGKPEASEVMARITAHDEAERMPPADKGRALDPHGD